MKKTSINFHYKTSSVERTIWILASILSLIFMVITFWTGESSTVPMYLRIGMTIIIPCIFIYLGGIEDNLTINKSLILFKRTFFGHITSKEQVHVDRITRIVKLKRNVRSHNYRFLAYHWQIEHECTTILPNIRGIEGCLFELSYINCISVSDNTVSIKKSNKNKDRLHKIMGAVVAVVLLKLLGLKSLLALVALVGTGVILFFYIEDIRFQKEIDSIEISSKKRKRHKKRKKQCEDCV